MSDSDLFKRFKDAMGVPWEEPPGSKRLPGVDDDPLPIPPPGSPEQHIRPDDIRSSAVAEPGVGSMITRNLPGADVTLMVTPPEGDDLWTIRGRIWLDPPDDTVGIKAALCQGENVLAVEDVSELGEFELRDILVGAWSLEFHLSDGRCMVVRGPEV